MAIDPTLLTKAAKVYEAAESVEGMKPKEVHESHKKCAPGEFGMNKEGGMFAKFVKKTAADVAEQMPRNYLKTEDHWLNTADHADILNTLYGTPAGRDYRTFGAANPMGIGGAEASDIAVHRGAAGGSGPGTFARRLSDGYETLSTSPPPKVPMGQPRPPVKMPPRGAGPRPAPTPKPAPAVPAVKASSDWKGFDYSNVGPGGLISSRTLPKTDATAKNWQASQGTPRKPGSATAPASAKAPPMKPVPPPMKPVPPPMKKVSAAYEFGSNILPGAGLGAALGGLYGLAAPGEEEEYDDTGRMVGRKPRSRFAAALRGALGGGLLGGAGGVAADHYRPNMANEAYSWAKGLLSPKQKALVPNIIKKPSAQLRLPPRKPQLGPAAPMDIQFPGASDFDPAASNGPMGPGDPHA